MSALITTARQPLAVADSNANITPAIHYLSDFKGPGTVVRPASACIQPALTLANTHGYYRPPLPPL
jgi:hypothetical protein